MRRNSSRWLLVGVLIAAHAGGACASGGGIAIGGPGGDVIVAQLEDGRWARGHTAPPGPTSSFWNLRLKDGRVMHGYVLSEEEARAAQLPPPSLVSSGPESEPGTVFEPGPDPEPNPDPGCGVDYEC